MGKVTNPVVGSGELSNGLNEAILQEVIPNYYRLHLGYPIFQPICEHLSNKTFTFSRMLYKDFLTIIITKSNSSKFLAIWRRSQISSESVSEVHWNMKEFQEYWRMKAVRIDIWSSFWRNGTVGWLCEQAFRHCILKSHIHLWGVSWFKKLSTNHLHPACEVFIQRLVKSVRTPLLVLALFGKTKLGIFYNYYKSK